MDHATMLYKMPGPHLFNDGAYDYVVVDAPEVEEKLKEGWFKTPSEAKAAHEEAKKAEFLSAATAGQSTKEPLENAPPTRAELEVKANELGLKFDGRTSDKKLGEMIEAKLKA